MDHFHEKDGTLHAEGVSLEAIADAVGTPFYCYSTATLVRHARVFQEAVAAIAPRPLVAFAVKANPNVAVVRTLAREGLGADVVSEGELRRALLAGVDPAKILFSGVGKTDAELRIALDTGVGQINVESEPELYRLSEIAAAAGKEAPVALRINPDVDAKTHAKISTGLAENKFGIGWESVGRIYAAGAGLPGVAMKGIAAHIGSQITELSPFEAAWNKVGEMVRRLRGAGLAVERVDLGGGLGVPYGDDGRSPPSPAEYGALAARVTKGWDVQLMFEPGRVIVGNAGVLVSRVVLVKEGERRRFVVLDAAMNDLLRPALYEAYHDIRAVGPVQERQVATFVGPVCETGDTFAEDREGPAVARGDLVALMTAGAYGATMAGTYNSRRLVPEVLVDGDRFAVIRKRQTFEDMLAADLVPDWLEDRK